MRVGGVTTVDAWCTRTELLSEAQSQDDLQLLRLTYEYLPFWFGVAMVIVPTVERSTFEFATRMVHAVWRMRATGVTFSRIGKRWFVSRRLGGPFHFEVCQRHHA